MHVLRQSISSTHVGCVFSHSWLAMQWTLFITMFFFFFEGGKPFGCLKKAAHPKGAMRYTVCTLKTCA